MGEKRNWEIWVDRERGKERRGKRETNRQIDWGFEGVRAGEKKEEWETRKCNEKRGGKKEKEKKRWIKEKKREARL